MLTPLELDIMKAVWRTPPVTVRDVQEIIRPTRNLAYTTVMTILDRLHQKGFVTRKLQSRTHYYEPAVAFVDVRDEAVKTLIKRFFDGKEAGLREFLDGSSSERVPRLPEFSKPANFDETLL